MTWLRHAAAVGAVLLGAASASAQEAAPVATSSAPTSPAPPPVTPPAAQLAAQPAPAAPSAAPVPPVPDAAKPNGLWLILAGAGLTAGGAIDLATAPLCRLSTIRASAQPACIGTSIAFGAALLGAGIPLLVVGARQRAAYVPVAEVKVGSASLAWKW